MSFQPSSSYKPDRASSELLNFPRHTGIREASLLLVREKNGRYTLLREPLYLDRCVVCTENDWEDYFEVQEILSKESFIFKVCRYSYPVWLGTIISLFSIFSLPVFACPYDARACLNLTRGSYRLYGKSSDQAEDGSKTKQWYSQLQYHSQGMGTWRKRRNALANIMINGMMTRT